MAKPVFRYNVIYQDAALRGGFGLSGCYTPDSYYGPCYGTTRREFAAMIRGQIEFYDLPKSCIRQVRINRAWSHIKRYGSSTAHFSIHHKANVLEFVGLTEEEYNEAEAANELL